MDRYWWAPDSGCILASVGHRCGCIGFTEAAPTTSTQRQSCCSRIHTHSLLTPSLLPPLLKVMLLLLLLHPPKARMIRSELTLPMLRRRRLAM